MYFVLLPNPGIDDECQPRCQANATCTVVDGSYQCQCRSGFSGDGEMCSSKNKIETSKASGLCKFLSSKKPHQIN